MTKGIGEAILAVGWIGDNLDAGEKVFVFAPVAGLIALIYFQIWVNSEDPKPSGRQWRAAAWLAVANALLLWGASASLDFGGASLVNQIG